METLRGWRLYLRSNSASRDSRYDATSSGVTASTAIEWLCKKRRNTRTADTWDGITAGWKRCSVRSCRNRSSEGSGRLPGGQQPWTSRSNRRTGDPIATFQRCVYRGESIVPLPISRKLGLNEAGHVGSSRFFYTGALLL